MPKINLKHVLLGAAFLVSSAIASCTAIPQESCIKQVVYSVQIQEGTQFFTAHVCGNTYQVQIP